jgi:hypothetical protein
MKVTDFILQVVKAEAGAKQVDVAQTREVIRRANDILKENGIDLYKQIRAIKK